MCLSFSHSVWCLCTSLAATAVALICDRVKFAIISLAALAFGVTDNTWQPNSRPWRFIHMFCSLGTVVGVTLNLGPSLRMAGVCTGCVGVVGGGVKVHYFLKWTPSSLSVMCWKDTITLVRSNDSVIVLVIYYLLTISVGGFSVHAKPMPLMQAEYSLIRCSFANGFLSGSCASFNFVLFTPNCLG